MSLISSRRDWNTYTLTLPGLTLPAGEVYVAVGWGGPDGHTQTFTVSHPAVGTWAAPPEGRATTTNSTASDWNIGTQLVHGSSSGGSGDLVLQFDTAQAKLYKLAAAVWGPHGASLEWATYTIDGATTELPLNLAQSGDTRLSVAFANLHPATFGGWSEAVQFWPGEWHDAASGSDPAGTKWTLTDSTYAAAAVGCTVAAPSGPALAPRGAALGFNLLGV